MKVRLPIPMLSTKNMARIAVYLWLLIGIHDAIKWQQRKLEELIEYEEPYFQNVIVKHGDVKIDGECFVSTYFLISNSTNISISNCQFMDSELAIREAQNVWILTNTFFCSNRSAIVFGNVSNVYVGFCTVNTGIGFYD